MLTRLRMACACFMYAYPVPAGSEDSVQHDPCRGTAQPSQHREQSGAGVSFVCPKGASTFCHALMRTEATRRVDVSDVRWNRILVGIPVRVL